MRARSFGMLVVLANLGIGCTIELPSTTETIEVTPPEPTAPAPDSPSDPAASSAPSTDPVPVPTGEPGATAAVGAASAPAPAPDPTPDPTPAEVTPTSLSTDFCDEVSLGKTKWVNATRNKITLRYVPGTAAEKDLEGIAALRNTLYVQISAALGVADAGNITIVLSPNRATATENGYGKGIAYASSNWIEVLWLGQADSYEMTSPGHELTHVIAQKVDGKDHLPFLDEGLAEYFDGSGRNLHDAYVRELRAGIDSAYLTRFSDGDVWGDHYGRAGSFVKFLIERGGMAKFLEVWRANAVTWSGGGYLTQTGVTVKNGADLETAIDKASRATYGIGFDALRLEWQTALNPFLTAPAQTVSADDAKAISNVIANLDWADSHGSADALRSTMEGFYCDWQSDDSRATIASSSVLSRGAVKTDIVALFPISVRNYPQAVAHTVRHEKRPSGEVTFASRVWLEKFPVGWRITYADRY